MKTIAIYGGSFNPIHYGHTNVAQYLINEKIADDVHLMVAVWPNADCVRDGEEFEKAGLFLPGSRIYDAFSPEARELYWQQCRRFWMNGGTDALWCDSCEPITDPD